MNADRTLPAHERADARFWDREARAYAKSPIADPVGYTRTLDRVAALLGPGDAVLELGCGTGTTALALAPKVASYVATDLSSEMIAIAGEKVAAAPVPGLRFAVATSASVPARPGGYDAVLAFNLLHLVADLEETLRLVRAQVRPGGLFVSKTACVGEMNPLIRWAIPVMRWFGRAPATVAVLREADLVAALTASGFVVEAVERHGAKGRDVRVVIVARRPAD